MRFALIITAAVVLAASWAGPAAAETSPWPAGLTEAEQRGWVSTITGDVTVEDGLTSAEDRLYARTLRQTGTLAGTATFHCKTARARAVAKNVWGGTVFWYRQRLGWCYNGGVIVKGYGLTPRCRGTDYGITALGFSWEFEGHVDCRSAGGVGAISVLRWRKGHFRHCVIRLGCIQHLFPYAWVRGYYNGYFRRGWGGA